MSPAHVSVAGAPTVAPTAPLQIELRFRVDLSPGETFDLVANRLPEWFGAIHAVTWDHARSTAGPGTPGACSERTCEIGGKTLHEHIVAFQPGRHYAYRADMKRSQLRLPLLDHLGTFDVEADGDGSVVTWRQHFRARWFVPAAILRWQMRDRLMRPAIDALLAKHGGAHL